MDEDYEPLDSYDVSTAVANKPTEVESITASTTTTAPVEEPTPSTTRRPMAKLNSDRLLSENGLPWIKLHAKRVKLSGEKGPAARAQDLKKILRFYEMWAHRLYPRYGFREFTLRAEKICHSRRMQIHLQTWQAEARGAVANESDMTMEEDMTNHSIEDQDEDRDDVNEVDTNDVTTMNVQTATNNDITMESIEPTEITTNSNGGNNTHEIIEEDEGLMLRKKTRQSSQKWILFDEEEDEEITTTATTTANDKQDDTDYGQSVNTNVDSTLIVTNHEDEDEEEVMSDASIEL
ncbi:replication fork protection component Swi3-domain-containing protein [Syncephalis plumigaleata]|nr:replication fork protection component Swi3-domain-containing protein [Syncephalis plumigaleata]